MTDLGIDRRRVAEWRIVRDAGEPVVETAITKALSEGRAPTKAEILETAKEIYAERADEKRTARTEREAALAAKIVAFPDRRYGVLYADPPWRFEPWSRETGMDRAADNHYPTMSFEALCELKIPAAPDCALFLWATVPCEGLAHDLLKAWGFGYRTNYVWHKNKLGPAIGIGTVTKRCCSACMGMSRHRLPAHNRRRSSMLRSGGTRRNRSSLRR